MRAPREFIRRGSGGVITHGNCHGLDVKKMLTDGLSFYDIDKLRAFVESELAGKISKSKMRKLYENVVKTRSYIGFEGNEEEIKRNLIGLLVICKYEISRAGHNEKGPLERLYNCVLEPALKEMEQNQYDIKQIKRFIDLMEALVAFM